MRAELNKGPDSIVFVWGAYGIQKGDVSIYTYRGMQKVKANTYSKGFGRDMWKGLVAKGYCQRSSKIPQVRPIYCQG